MPYLICPACRLEAYSAAGYATTDRCHAAIPRSAELSARTASFTAGRSPTCAWPCGRRPTMALAEPQERIDERVRQGGSLAQVEEEIIDSAPSGEEQKAALWLYASATIPRDLAEATAEAAHESRSRLGEITAALRSAGSEAVPRTRGTGGLDLPRRLSRVSRRLAPKSLPLPWRGDGAAEARASQTFGVVD